MIVQEEIDTRDSKLELEIDCIPGYQLLDENFSTDGKPSSIGRGGSGIVYKARQILYADSNAYVDRAIKFFMYQDSILVSNPEKKPISGDDFISEIGNITTFNHQSLIRVISAGYHNCASGKIPYIISDLIEGTTLKAVIKPKTPTDKEIREKFLKEPDTVLDMLLEIAYAIKHIHDRGYAHCDIAPKNIFINFDDNALRPILGDLGISRKIKSKGKTSLRIIGSKKWMPPELHAHYDKEVDYNIFSSSQPHWDLYSFSKTGLKLLEIYNDDDPRSWFNSLKKYLKNACDNKNCEIDDIIERLEFLKPIHREVASIPELSMGVGSGRRKMMPVEALTTTKRLHDLIRHPALIRLSFVPQLTTANQILPGANHTRYEHTLGVIETMRRYLLSLLDESEFLEHLSTKKIETALVAAALASATRFPLSNIVHEIKSKDKNIFTDFSKHRLYLRLLNIEDSKGVALKNLIRRDFPNVEIKNIVSILCDEIKKFDEADQLIYSLLNNSLDVRVIDFIRRDCHHLGINSGDSFKIDEILPHVTIHDHKLSLKIQGVSVAEQIILLRYWLFNRVYWNQPNRTFCAMARTVLLKLHHYEGFKHELSENIFKLDQRRIIDFLISYSSNHLPKKYQDLSQRLSGEEHTLYRILFETSKINADLEGKYEILGDLDLVQLDDLATKIWRNLSTKQNIFSNDEIIPVIVDYPIEPNNTKMGEDVIVRIKKSEFKKLFDVSGIINGVNTSFDNQLSRLRVFMHPDLISKLEDKNECREICKGTINSFLKEIENQ